MEGVIGYPVISPQFTIEDIHKVREYNYEITKDMTWEEEIRYYKVHSADFEARIAEGREKYLARKSMKSTI